tara:strand:- start:1650 stop:3116 length:1467 start_codon:yes stop_codon:yes gene_type:complete
MKDIIFNLPYWYYLLFIILIVFIYDLFQKEHAILRNFPIVGHFRYWIEKIGPELRQYIVSNDKEEMPFNRSERSWIYATAKKEQSTFGFGTTEQLYEIGYPIIKHSMFPFFTEKTDPNFNIPCKKIVGKFNKRKKTYKPQSIINISAMSFGSLGENAISALNKGSLEANCYHNTGEGGVSPYHNHGADIVWQIGTGYFGARAENGEFSLSKFKRTVENNPNIKMIEVKLSQGAKPGKGGILPAEKVTKEISQIRGIPIGKACMSPNSHSSFTNVDSLIDFIELLATTSGLPIGIKSAIGKLDFWNELAQKMKTRNEGPDFIAIDGGEGGTGAAPLAFTDHVSLPFKVGFKRVYSIFKKEHMTERIVWIGSAKLGFPDRAIIAMSMGCDIINVAREAMISIGCIQAQKCHTGHCPTGVATQQKWLQRGLNVIDKSERCAQYIKGFRKELLQLTYASGYQHPSEFTGQDIEISSGVNKFLPLENIIEYKK